MICLCPYNPVGIASAPSFHPHTSAPRPTPTRRPHAARIRVLTVVGPLAHVTAARLIAAQKTSPHATRDNKPLASDHAPSPNVFAKLCSTDIHCVLHLNAFHPKKAQGTEAPHFPGILVMLSKAALASAASHSTCREAAAKCVGRRRSASRAVLSCNSRVEVGSASRALG